MRVGKLLCLVLLVVWEASLQASSKPEGGNLHYGITYPDMSLATRESPAALSIEQADRLSVNGHLPFSSYENTLTFDDKAQQGYPTWVTYVGNPKPFGLGLSGTIDKVPEVFAAGAFGTDKIQVGYLYHNTPKTQISTSTYSLRLGGLNEHAMTLIWGDEKKAIGFGFVFNWFVMEADATFSLTFDEDPQPSLVAGIQSETIGCNFGYKASHMKEFQTDRRTRMMGFFYKPWKTFLINLYYQRFISQYSAGLALLIP